MNPSYTVLKITVKNGVVPPLISFFGKKLEGGGHDPVQIKIKKKIFRRGGHDPGGGMTPSYTVILNNYFIASNH